MKSSILLLLTCCYLALNTGRAQPSEAKPIPFYLPVHSDAMTQKVTQLGIQLHAMGLTQVQPTAVKYWNNYQQAIRQGRRGIYLAAPHYSAWAVIKHNFVPLFRIAERLQYVIIVRRGDSHLFEISDLDKKRVCAQKPLNLDYLLINQAFDNPVLSADIISVLSVENEIIENNNRCDGFVISVARLNEIDTAQTKKFIRLRVSPEYKNYSIVANPNIEQAVLNQLSQTLENKQVLSLLEPLLLQFASRAALISSSYEDYHRAELTPLLRYWKK